MTWLPTEADLLASHARSLELYGGLPGVRSPGSLESACAAPHRSAFGTEVFETVEAKACAVAFEILRQHPFTDGNKRVGLRALLMTLRKNGRILLDSNEAVEALVLAVVAKAPKDRMDLDGMVAWVSERVRLML